MFKQLILLGLALAFVCSGNGVVLRGSEYDSRPVIQVIANEKYLARVPVLEDLNFDEESLLHDIKSTRKLNSIALGVASDLILKGKDSYGWMFSTFVKLIRAIVGLVLDPQRGAQKLGDNRIHYSEKMAKLLREMANSEPGILLSDEDTFDRVKTVLGALDQIVLESPVGLYLDLEKLVIGELENPPKDGTGHAVENDDEMKIDEVTQTRPDFETKSEEGIVEFIRPVMSWFKHNNREFVISAINKVAGMLENEAKKRALKAQKAQKALEAKQNSGKRSRWSL